MSICWGKHYTTVVSTHWNALHKTIEMLLHKTKSTTTAFDIFCQSVSKSANGEWPFPPAFLLPILQHGLQCLLSGNFDEGSSHSRYSRITMMLTEALQFLGRKWVSNSSYYNITVILFPLLRNYMQDSALYLKMRTLLKIVSLSSLWTGLHHLW